MNNLPVILTGIRSNGELTLGNYLGSMLPLARMQASYSTKYQFNVFVPDLHSFTTPVEHNNLYANTLSNLKHFIAAGIDIYAPNTYVYRQSFIPAHTELTWILDCFIYFGELSRMTQFKEKSEGKDKISAGLFNYPALMAADILLYDAKYIPVGEDQRQHIELARDVAIRMNNQFGELFTIPEPWHEQLKFSHLQQGVRIRSLKNPLKKMSKSVQDPAGTILLSDKPEAAAQKIIAATTDSYGSINYDFNRQPGVSNLLQIISILNNKNVSDVANEWRGKSSYGELKKVAADLVASCLSAYQAKLQTIDEQSVLSALHQDESAMNQIATAKLYAVQKAVGLRQ